MDMDDFLKPDEKEEQSRTANVRELIEKLKSQSNEETHKRLDTFLNEAAAIFEFTSKRIDELSKEYEELAALGDFGCVMSATLQGKPLCYSALGSSSGITNATKFVMLKTMAMKLTEKDDDEQDESSGEDE